MSDLVVFLGLVGLVAAVGIGAGIIVAGRIDRILERPDPADRSDEHADTAAEPPADRPGPSQEDRP